MSGTSGGAGGIPVIQKGAANGVATLGPDGKVPSSELNVTGGIQYVGDWDASTNTPTLADGTGTAGDVYKVSAAGTQDLGSGSITFQAGDEVLYDGTQWDRIPFSAAVASVAGKTGVVTLVKGDVGLGQVDNTSDADKPVSTAQAAAIGAKVSKSGDTMSGALDMGSNRVTNVAAPTAASDAVTKQYVDAYANDEVSKSGDTMSGDLSMGSNKIISLAAPTSDADATNKAYVDSAVAGATPPAPTWGNITGTLSNQTDLANALAAKVSAGGKMKMWPVIGANDPTPGGAVDGDIILRRTS